MHVSERECVHVVCERESVNGQVSMHGACA